MNVGALFGIDDRPTDEHREIAGRLWQGWPGLVRQFTVTLPSGTVTLDTGGASTPGYRQAAGIALSALYELPVEFR